MLSIRATIIFSIMLCFVIGSAQDEDKKLSVFDQPSQLAEFRQLEREFALAVKNSDLDKALQLTQRGVEMAPADPLFHYNLACVLARKKRIDEALTHLKKSVQLGMINQNHISKDSDLESLRETKQYKEVLTLAAELVGKKIDRYKDQITPYPITENLAKVQESNTAWDPRAGSFLTRFEFPDKSEHPIASGETEVDTLLKQWFAAGKAAGNHGDLYENRDGFHSPLDLNKFPQMGALSYQSPQELKLNMGGQKQFLHKAVVLGNSSTALIHPLYWRSQTRALYTTAGGPIQLARQYQSNHLYCYPEHKDHDIGHNGVGLAEDAAEAGYGDVFPANTPYVVISQGSSYTDKPFLEAIAATLAAFQPETKQKLIATGGLMPAVQMILRSSNPELITPEDYLTGKAHPTVFDKPQLDPLAMIKKANQIESDKLPPRVMIQVLQEEGSNYQNNHRLFDTPQAVARVFHSHRDSIKLVVSAQRSFDPNGGKLSCQWRVLRGDADRIKIQPLDSSGAKVGITIPYHQRMAVAEGSELASNRVDIGVFVKNAHHYSAPAFISVYFPDNQKREYDSDGKIRSIDFYHPEVRDNYVDAQLYPMKKWRDEFNYSKAGEMTGWNRIRGEGEDQTVEEFTKNGALIISKDKDGKPTKTQRVQYRIEQTDENVSPEVVQFIPGKPPQSTSSKE